LLLKVAKYYFLGGEPKIQNKNYANKKINEKTCLLPLCSQRDFERFFRKSVSGFQKWTKINVQN